MRMWFYFTAQSFLRASFIELAHEFHCNYACDVTMRTGYIGSTRPGLMILQNFTDPRNDDYYQSSSILLIFEVYVQHILFGI